MIFVQLGSTNIKVSRIALGCGNFGVEYAGAPSKADSIATVHKALDIGINCFDTANVYGFWRSESILAEALSMNRKNVIIATKVGVKRTQEGKAQFDLSYTNIVKSVEESLKRLNTDYIDIYQTHWPDNSTPISDTVNALEHLLQSGKIRYVGASNVDVSHIKQYISLGCLDTVQVRYNLFQREIEEEVLPLCAEKNIGVLAYSPLFRGLLSGKFTPRTKFENGDSRQNQPEFKGEKFRQYLKITDKIKIFAQKRNLTIVQLSVAWVLRNSNIDVAIYGASRPDHITESLYNDKWNLSEIDFIDLNKQCIKEFSSH